MNQKKDLFELLDLAREGDDVALNLLLREVQPQLYRFSMNMCRHPEDAEDVLQESLLSLARSVHGFRGAASFSTWMYTIARSFCIKKRRKKKHAPSIEESFEMLSETEGDNFVSNTSNPEEVLQSAELWKHIHSAIKLLEPEHREVLVLRDIEGLSAKEVSTITGNSVSSVKNRLHRARAQLREYLTSTRPYHREEGCPDIRRMFSEHLEGDLSATLCSTMEAHISNCASCASECKGLKNALNACSSSPNEVPEHIKARVQAALLLAWKENK